MSLSHKNVPSAGAVAVAGSLKKKMVLSFPLSKIQIPIELCELTLFRNGRGFIRPRRLDSLGISVMT